MGTKIHLTIGAKFGWLTIIRFNEDLAPNWWVCECKCGKSCNRSVANLRRKDVIASCGCWRRSKPHYGKPLKHGDCLIGRRTREHKIWCDIKSRCLNEKNKHYSYYGGRGIRLCQRWYEYVNFLADMGRSPTVLHTVERIDNNKGYEPSNCKWATRKEQMRNRRTTPMFEPGISLADECEKRQFPYKIAFLRHKKGDPKKMWFSPLRRRQYLQALREGM